MQHMEIMQAMLCMCCQTWSCICESRGRKLMKHMQHMEIMQTWLCMWSWIWFRKIMSTFAGILPCKQDLALLNLRQKAYEAHAIHGDHASMAMHVLRGRLPCKHDLTFCEPRGHASMALHVLSIMLSFNLMLHFVNLEVESLWSTCNTWEIMQAWLCMCCHHASMALHVLSVRSPFNMILHVWTQA